MKITNVNYETGLSFEDVVKHIPTLTSNNEVITDEEIVKFELTLENNKTINIFLDCATTEYCFKSKYKLDNVGGVIQSHLFKYENTSDFLNSDNMEWLMLDILAEEV